MVLLAGSLMSPLFCDPRRSHGGKDAILTTRKVGERLAEWVRSLGIDKRVAGHVDLDGLTPGWIGAYYFIIRNLGPKNGTCW